MGHRASRERPLEGDPDAAADGSKERPSSRSDQASTEAGPADGVEPVVGTRGTIGQRAGVQRSVAVGSEGSEPEARGSDGGYVPYDPGPDRQALRARHGIELHQGQARTLQRLEADFGTHLVNRWADEGMPVEAMGKPLDMEAFRERQSERPEAVPTDVERRNEASLQRNAAGNRDEGPAGETGVPEVVRNVVSSPGRSMDESVQREMETKVGGDFADVQIHTGSQAAAAAEAIDARAFTVGTHVAFNRGEYRPESSEGRRVLAHELTHVRQQTEGAVQKLAKGDTEHPGPNAAFDSGVPVQTKLDVSSPDDPAEREAEAVAETVVETDAGEAHAPGRRADSDAGGVDRDDRDIGPMGTVRGRRAGGGEVSKETESTVRSGVRGGGKPLPAETRSNFEAKMGADFSDVRVHAGSGADEAAKSIDAEAYTMGSDIAFADGKYDPKSTSGRELLAHELTHVAQSSNVGRAVHRFSSPEHLRIGDEATGGNEYDLLKDQDDEYVLSHGEIVAMGGDYFGSLQQMRRLARDEDFGRRQLEYVRRVLVHKNDEAADDFDDPVIQAANERYYQLAESNRRHFMNPREGDEGKTKLQKIREQRQGSGRAGGALGGYRNYHELAIAKACQAAQRDDLELGEALAAEAFGGHFLTDMFSSGHTITPRIQIAGHWDDTYPMFFDNFVRYASEEMARYVNQNTDEIPDTAESYKAWVGSELQVYDEVHELFEAQLEEMGMPDMTFGDLVSGAVHDYDNKHGIEVTIRGTRMTIKGDDYLDEDWQGRVTEANAETAVEMGADEVERAHRRCQIRDPAYLPTYVDELMADLKGDNGLYIAEEHVPIPTETDEGWGRDLDWEKSGVMELLADDNMASALELFLDNKSESLAGVGDDLPHAAAQNAWNERVIDPMSNRPIATLEAVVNWTPSGLNEWGFDNERDDRAREYVDEYGDSLDKLTETQAIDLTSILLDGPTKQEDERAIMSLLEQSDWTEEIIEAHGWSTLSSNIHNFDFEGEFSEFRPEGRETSESGGANVPDIGAGHL